MRFIKEYAQFNDTPDSLYEPITYDEYIEFVSSKSDWGKPLGFTDREVNLIKSVLGSEDKFQLLTNGPASKNPKGELISISGGYFGNFWSKKSTWGIIITKYSDDWFIAQSEKLIDKQLKTFSSGFHKCDTIDGVIQLIRDISSSSMNESVDNSDDYYFEISKADMESIPNSQFIDIDEKILDLIKDNITNYIKENCPRIDIYTTEDNWIGTEKTGIRISGFDYHQSGSDKGKWHPHQTIKWIRRVKISELKDEWFLVSFTMSDYSMYFKCDQLDGLMRLLEDYYICESGMVKESMEEDKEILSDYFINFEDGGGKVLIYYNDEDGIYVVQVFTNEKNLRKKINWNRLERDWKVLDWTEGAHRVSGLPKRSFKIWLSKKEDIVDYKPLIESVEEDKERQLGINESKEESLAKKMSVSEWQSFENSHHMIKPDESDYKLYKEFMLDNFTLEEVGNFENVNYNFGFDWSCEFEELNEEGENYSCGVITIYKFDDEWWVVEHMVKGWHDTYNHWLVDTKLGFKDIKLWD